MKGSEELIEVLEYLGGKLGMTVDWTNRNILPYLQDLCRRDIRWAIVADSIWILISTGVFATIVYGADRCCRNHIRYCVLL